MSRRWVIDDEVAARLSRSTEKSNASSFRRMLWPTSAFVIVAIVVLLWNRNASDSTALDSKQPTLESRATAPPPPRGARPPVAELPPARTGIVVCWGDNVSAACTPPPDLGLVRSVSAGGSHSAAIRADGRVVCWGAGQTNTQLGSDWGQSIVPADLLGARAIASGGYHNLVIALDGSVACGGRDKEGQCKVPDTLGSATSIAAGWFHSIAVTTRGEIVAWGSTSGRYNFGQSTIPDGLPPTSVVAGGYYHTIAVSLDGAVSCWGNNWFGQCIVPENLGAVTAVAGGYYHSVALKRDGSVACWGAGTTSLGTDPNFGQSIVPSALGPVCAITAGGWITAAAQSSGAVTLWGQDCTKWNREPSGDAITWMLSAGEFHIIGLQTELVRGSSSKLH